MGADQVAQTIIENQNVGVVVSQKGLRDLVTSVDVAIEEAVVRCILGSDKDASILCEEMGWVNGPDSGGAFWVVDPIDGTVNFSRNFHHYGVSISYIVSGEPVIGAVLIHRLGRIYLAEKGGGAFRNGERISASDVRSCVDSIVGFGDFAAGSNAKEKNVERTKTIINLADRVLRVRMNGFAAGDLCFVAMDVWMLVLHFRTRHGMSRQVYLW